MKPRIVVVDEEDNIIGHEERAAVDEKGLRYRVSALWITNSQGDILLAKRAMTKKHDPGKWGPAVAGTVDEGESYEDNIIKEAEEEIGLTNFQMKKGPKTKSDGKHKHFTQWFLAVVDKPSPSFTRQEEEVAEIRWFSKEEIEACVREHPDEFLVKARHLFDSSTDDEFLDIVNDQDEVLYQAEKNEAKSKRLRRRIVHVLIFNQKGKLLLQKRGPDCQFMPGSWSTSVGGHVSAEETYEQAAEKEFFEELGVKTKMTLIGKDLYTDGQGLELFLTTFKTTYEGPFTLEAGKVDEVKFFPIEEVKAMIDQGEAFHPELLFLLKKYFF